MLNPICINHSHVHGTLPISYYFPSSFPISYHFPSSFACYSPPTVMLFSILINIFLYLLLGMRSSLLCVLFTYLCMSRASQEFLCHLNLEDEKVPADFFYSWSFFRPLLSFLTNRCQERERIDEESQSRKFVHHYVYSILFFYSCYLLFLFFSFLSFLIPANCAEFCSD